jgi:hypothetical protein
MEKAKILFKKVLGSCQILFSPLLEFRTNPDLALEKGNLERVADSRDYCILVNICGLYFIYILKLLSFFYIDFFIKVTYQ